jgi:hypothetical protein
MLEAAARGLMTSIRVYALRRWRLICVPLSAHPPPRDALYYFWRILEIFAAEQDQFLA